MIIKSTKFVDLPDEKYCGIWLNWVMVIPFVVNDVNDDMEIPVSRGTETEKKVFVNVVNNSFQFEGE